MKKYTLSEENLSDIRYNLIQEAVRYIQEQKVYQGRVCELVKDREANAREINEYSEKVICAKAALRAVSGVAVQCFGISVVDFENQAYAVYRHCQEA